ncbi:MAG: hypothetical protein G3W61_33435, partial [Xanthomonas perforans]|nr:hypothetical protein [Xanthomonas perforans]
PEYDWGRLLDEGLAHLYTNPMAAIGPGLAVVFAALVFTMIAETIGDQPGQGLRALAKATRAATLGRRVTAAAAPAAGTGAPGSLAEVRN